MFHKYKKYKTKESYVFKGLRVSQETAEGYDATRTC